MKRRALLPNFALDRTSHEALHCQLAAALHRAIHGGELPPGAILPSTRALAHDLGVSRNTVVIAYEELAAEGLLMARAGSATRVYREHRRVPCARTGAATSRVPVSGRPGAIPRSRRQHVIFPPLAHASSACFRFRYFACGARRKQPYRWWIVAAILCRRGRHFVMWQTRIPLFQAVTVRPFTAEGATRVAGRRR